MAFLNLDGEVYWMDGDGISIDNKIPIGIWQLVGTKMGPKLIPIKDFKLSHGKIYGNSQIRANHIVEAFKKNENDRNLGVLLSGGRGLGKTLTTRLVIEQIKDDYPIITISEYVPGMNDFLSHVKKSVILMDEFEKFMSGNIKGNDAEDEQTKQETLLSVLDGNTGSAGNLYLLTANHTYKLDENLISRPGRIRYHYKYMSEPAEVVRSYCQDNLNDKSKIEEVVYTLGLTKYVSMDIISSFVDELNKFPNETPSSVKDYFNLDTTSDRLIYEITLKGPLGLLTYSLTYEGSDMPQGYWFHLKSEDYKKILKKAGIKKDSEEEESFDYPHSIKAALNGTVPSFIMGSEDLDTDIVDIDSVSWSIRADTELDTEEWSIEKAVVIDPEYKIFSKRYNKNTI
jgi:hypothetical protein